MIRPRYLLPIIGGAPLVAMGAHIFRAKNRRGYSPCPAFVRGCGRLGEASLERPDAPSASRPLRQRKTPEYENPNMIFSRLTTVVFLGAALAGCSNEAHANAIPSQQEAAHAPDEPTATTLAAAQVTIPIEGMACDSCAEHLQHQLARLDGVLTATVDFDKKEARVKFDPTKVAIKTLVSEINKAFKAGKPLEPREGGER